MKTSRIVLLVAALVVGVATLALAVDWLCGGYVYPTSGSCTTWFTYYVSWCGTGTPPTGVYVHIDGDLTGILMTYFTEIGGYRWYKYTTTLPDGDHYFYFTDSLGGRDPDQGDPDYVGPLVENK
ncbi:MAG: hypothetical protein JW759_05660 [Candidatus Coatesbacteria bacterium]|nr:hypothetical protein [Candidatus Coatesbacteria bacterium]